MEEGGKLMQSMILRQDYSEIDDAYKIDVGEKSTWYFTGVLWILVKKSAEMIHGHS